MMKFTEFVEGPLLLESVSDISRLPHIEDVVFRGEEGYHKAVGALQAVSDKINGKFNTTKVLTQYHGKPSIVFGYHPDNGRFFVSTKDKYEKHQNYTPEDAEKYHEPEVAGIVKTALLHLSKITPKKGIFHGDVLGYETDEENPKRSKMTLAVNSRTGHLNEFANGYDPNVHLFKKSSNITIVPPDTEIGAHSGSSDLKYTHHMNAANNQFMTRHPDMFPTLVPHTVHLKGYVTNAMRNGESVSVQGYTRHLLDKGEAEKNATRSFKRGLDAYQKAVTDVKFVNDNVQHFEKAFKLFNHVQKAKESLMDTLKGGIDDESGHKPKGFVVIHNGSPMKLIDRKKVE